MFPSADQIKEKTSQSLVVYKINCKTCNVDYIGKTEKILVHRLKENQTQQLNSQSDYVIKTVIIQACPQHRKK